MIPTATKAVQDLLAPNFSKCESASLRLEKFVRVMQKEDEDKAKKNKEPSPKFTEINQICAAVSKHAKSPSFRFSVFPSALSVPMQLQSRLIINQAGGVLENAGLCLHPHFGCPMIPGSAVKGIARAAAVQAIQAAESAKDKSALLVKAALVFGWADQDWSTGKNRDKKTREETTFKSDFRYASDGNGWRDVWEDAARQLLAILKVPEKRIDPKKPTWESLPNFAGLISFLPALPVANSAIKLVPDLVNCHHPEYYQGKRQKATDDENPVPNFFPAIESGLTFEFVVVPGRRAVAGLNAELVPAKLADSAMAWLMDGLSSRGAGAKTNAGYGWFEKPGNASLRGASEPVSATVHATGIVDELKKLLFTPSGFQLALKKIADITDAQLLKRIFDEAFPDTQKRMLKKKNPYWQSFASRPEGKAFLDKIGITLN